MRKIFKWFTTEGGSELASAYTHWFASNFKPNDFNGIDKLLFCFIRYCSNLGVVPKSAFLDAYLKVDGKNDVKKYNIKTDTMQTYDYKQVSQLNEALTIIAQLAKTTYADYISEDLSDRDFKVDVYGYMADKRSQSLQQALMETYPKLSDGSDMNDVTADLMATVSDIQNEYDTSKINDIDFAPSTGARNEQDLEYICDTGIPAIDNDIGGIYTRLIYTFNAQPKSGKTRFALANWAYPVMMSGKDVIFYEAELTRSQVENILVAYHITRLYRGRIKIPDSVMNKYKTMTDEQKQIYESARIDLFESGRYGNFYFRKPFVVEKFKEEILAMNRASERGIGLIVLDYMGLAKSEPLDKWERRKEEYQIITDGYKAVGELRDVMNVAFLCINQFNDKGIDAAYAGKEIRPGMVQGGHIVQRHTDYDMNMTYTEEQYLAGVRSLGAGFVRGAAGFSGALLGIDLSVSIFKQQLAR